MGNTRVEAQTDGGLFIEVRNPNPDAADKRLVWARHYYVLPLEVTPFPIRCCLRENFLCSPFVFPPVCLCYASTFCPDLADHRPNAKDGSWEKTAPRKKSRLWILETRFFRRKSLQRCSEWPTNPNIFNTSLSRRYCVLHLHDFSLKTNVLFLDFCYVYLSYVVPIVPLQISARLSRIPLR